MTVKIGLISGSLRKESFSTKILKNIVDMFPQGYEAKLIDISDLEIYNEDIDQENPPESYKKFRQELEEMDGFIFATPEYNRTIPAAIKNAIDVGSRPYGQSKWDGKPAGVISSSPSGFGGMAANHALRQVFVFVNLIPMQQPEAYLANISDSFEEGGSFNERTEKFVQSYVDAFVKHYERLSK